MKFRCLLVLSFLLTAAAAQGRQKPGQKPGREIGREPQGVVNDAGETVAADGPDSMPKVPTEPGVRRGASSFCQFHVHSKPAKLLPGQTGTLIITAVLKGQAVLPSPAPLLIKSGAQQGALTLGAHEVRPAGLGRLAKGYVGRPVHDNWATIEMPVTVAANAAMGSRHPVSVELEFDLFDGVSALTIGKFGDRAVGTIEVGRTLDPEVRGGYTAPIEAIERGQPAGNHADPTVNATAPEQPNEALGGAEPTAPGMTPEPPPVEPEPDSNGPAPAVSDEAGMPWLLIGGGGALVVLVLLLALKKK